MSLNLATLIAVVVVTAAATWFIASGWRRAAADTRTAHGGREYLGTILNHIADGVIVVDPQGVIRTFNPVAERIFGYKESEVLEKNAGKLLTDLAAGTDGAIGVGAREVVGLRKSGATFQVDLNVCAAENRNDPAFVLIVRDITERKQAEQRLIYLAQYDALTGLPTRALFHDRAKHALARAHREEKLMALMYLDLDRFKSINDGMGHHVGDELLKAVAKRITSCLRDVDTVSRLGGDEFSVILESIPHIDNATIVAEKRSWTRCKNRFRSTATRSISRSASASRFIRWTTRT